MVKPLTKPNIIKKRTKPFKRHQTDRKICVKVTSCLQHFMFGSRCVASLVSYSVWYRNHGDALRVLTLESEESSRDVVLLCQTLVMAQTRRRGICCPMVRIAQTAQSFASHHLCGSVPFVHIFRFPLPAGFFKFVVSNVKELELLMMHNRSVTGLFWQFAGNTSN